MGSRRTIGIIVLVVGIAILALSLLADSIGIGGSPGFGYLQIAGVVVGAVVAAAGLVVAFRE